MKLELSDGSRCLERLYRADYVCNCAARRIVEMAPEDVLDLDNVVRGHDGMTVTFSELVWDDIRLTHDAGTISVDRIEPWFLRWCDPDAVRSVSGGAFALVAHAVILSRGEIWADLGTAPVEALPELLDVLHAAGARRIAVSDSRSDGTD